MDKIEKSKVATVIEVVIGLTVATALWFTGHPAWAFGVLIWACGSIILHNRRVRRLGKDQ